MRGVVEERRVAACVDDARCIARADVVTFDEERKEGHGHEETSDDVGLKGLGPVLRLGIHKVRGDGLRIAAVGLARVVEPGGTVTGDAGVID